MNIAFFDFDGTITFKDSLMDFIIYSAGFRKFISGFILLIPALVMYKLKILPNWRAKERVFEQFFSGWSYSEFDKVASDYSNNRLDKIVRESAIKKIDEHRSKGDTVVVVSASIEEWVKPWCLGHGIHFICTHLEISNGSITGKLSGRNCYGEEKVRRIKDEYDLSKYENIYAYGDSAGDLDMLSIANIAYYKWDRYKS